MTIHLSRILDNAPVRDAMVTVALRGAAHSTTAEADGSYALQTPDLTLPGAASIQFQVAFGATREELKGTLQIGETHREERREEQRAAALVVGAEFCRVHRLSHVVVETAKGRAVLRPAPRSPRAPQKLWNVCTRN